MGADSPACRAESLRGQHHEVSRSLRSIKAFQLTLLSSSLLRAMVAARRSEKKIPFFSDKFFVAAHTSPALLAALLLGEAKDTGMEIIHDALCNQHGDLLGHKYYHIHLHFLIFIHMACTLPQACRERTRQQGRIVPRAQPGGRAGWSCSRRSCCGPKESWPSKGPAAAQQGCWSRVWCCKPKNTKPQL